MVSQIPPDWNATRHAIVRMIEREVAVEAIDTVLLSYDIKRPTPPEGHDVRTDILIGEVLGRRLKVYVQRDADPPTIRAVAWEG